MYVFHSPSHAPVAQHKTAAMEVQQHLVSLIRGNACCRRNDVDRHSGDCLMFRANRKALLPPCKDGPCPLFIVHTADVLNVRSEEHTSALQSLTRISYAVVCLKKKNKVI